MATMKGDSGIALTPENVPLRDGPPTKEEMQVYYPSKWTWRDIKALVNSGDLGTLKRDKKLQDRYITWSIGTGEKYGSVVDYLVNYRLRWGQPDTLSLLQSEVEEDLPPPTDFEPTPYFSLATPPDGYCVIQNDWPYSLPSDVEHTVIWTKVPIYHPDIIDESIKARIDQDGLYGFTGLRFPPPSPSHLPSCLPGLAEWGITKDTMVVSPKGSEAEEALVERAGKPVADFVRARWKEDVWETAWFVNPPRLQSVLDLAHMHIFACKHS